MAPQLQPHPANMRVPCEEVMAQAADQALLIAAQQEYSVLPEQPTISSSAGMPYGMATKAMAAVAAQTPGLWSQPHAGGAPPPRRQSDGGGGGCPPAS
jgi:hypothetical protein